jgi:D-alanyl-D-alanine carboxypeptidase/D-alanyl-D-alanine-endopeptidase (penicillin-binding protein 4)
MMMYFCYSVMLLISFLYTIPCISQTPDPTLTRQLRDHVERVSKELGKKGEIFFSVYRVPDAQEIFSKGGDTPVHAASVQKLIITYAALRKLGAEYTIPTEFYTEYLPSDRDPRLDVSMGMSDRKVAPAESLGALYVRTYGNPTMQYEDLQGIARELRARGVNGVTDLVVDDSLFLEESLPTGDAPYQAAQSSASLEFNSYRVLVTPSASGMPPIISTSAGLFGTVLNRSKSLSGKGESLEIIQNPSFDLFPRSRSIGEITPQPLNLQINGRIGLLESTWEKYHSHPDPFLYFILSLKKALDSEGISVSGALRRAKVPSNTNLLFVHESEPLYSILSKLNRFSSNFIAGQLLYLVGQDENGYFSRKRGLEILKELLMEIDAFPENSNLDDASGLSGANRITPNQMVKLLTEVEKDISISPTFMGSLSRFGLSGTLKYRQLRKDEYIPSVKSSIYLDQEQRSQGVWAKTGTVDGVSSVAGYLERYQGFRLAFMIVLKGTFEKSRAVEIENDIIKILLGFNNKDL